MTGPYDPDREYQEEREKQEAFRMRAYFKRTERAEFLSHYVSVVYKANPNMGLDELFNSAERLTELSVEHLDSNNHV